MKTHSFLRTLPIRFVIILALLPWITGCGPTKRLVDESWVEVMGGVGRTTQDIFVPNKEFPGCGPVHIGKDDATLADGGIRYGHYFGKSGYVIEAGGGYVHTTNVSAPRWDVATTTTPHLGVRNSGFGYFSFGRDADDFGWRLGVFVSDSLHYREQTVFPVVRMRIGSMNSIHGEIGTMRDPTYISSGSIVDAGINFPDPDHRTNYYLGIGGGLGYASMQVVGQIEVNVQKHTSLKASGNFGVLNSNKKDGDAQEFGVGLGIKYLW